METIIVDEYIHGLTLPPRFSHDDARIGVLVAESRGVLDLERAGTCQRGSLRVRQHVSHVPRRRLLIVSPGGVRMLDDVVRNVGPELGLLPRSMPDTMQHLVGVHVSNDGELALLRLHINLRYSFHALHSFLHPSLTPFAVHLHFYLHRLIPSKNIITLCQPPH